MEDAQFCPSAVMAHLEYVDSGRSNAATYHTEGGKTATGTFEVAGRWLPVAVG